MLTWARMRQADDYDGNPHHHHYYLAYYSCQPRTSLPSYMNFNTFKRHNSQFLFEAISQNHTLPVMLIVSFEQPTNILEILFIPTQQPSLLHGLSHRASYLVVRCTDVQEYAVSIHKLLIALRTPQYDTSTKSYQEHTCHEGILAKLRHNVGSRTAKQFFQYQQSTATVHAEWHFREWQNNWRYSNNLRMPWSLSITRAPLRQTTLLAASTSPQVLRLPELRTRRWNIRWQKHKTVLSLSLPQSTKSTLQRRLQAQIRRWTTSMGRKSRTARERWCSAVSQRNAAAVC